MGLIQGQKLDFPNFSKTIQTGNTLGDQSCHGGAGNAQGGYYAICFLHEDKVDGNLWVLIKGRNTAGFTLTFSAEEGTVVEPEFKAMPHDDNGTLIELIEEIPTA